MRQIHHRFIRNISILKETKKQGLNESKNHYDESEHREFESTTREFESEILYNMWNKNNKYICNLNFRNKFKIQK